MQKLQKAIGLIEILLVIIVIAIMSIAAIRYYSSTQAAQKVNDATQVFGEVRSAFQAYLADNNNNPYKSGTTVIQVSDLYNAGYLPSTYQCCGTSNMCAGNANQTSSAGGGCMPYGGTISLAVASGLLTITMTGIPLQDCTPIANRLESTMNTNLSESAVGSCTSDTTSTMGLTNPDNTVTANYVM